MLKALPDQRRVKRTFLSLHFNMALRMSLCFRFGMALCILAAPSSAVAAVYNWLPWQYVNNTATAHINGFGDVTVSVDGAPANQVWDFQIEFLGVPFTPSSAPAVGVQHFDDNQYSFVVDLSGISDTHGLVLGLGNFAHWADHPYYKLSGCDLTTLVQIGSYDHRWTGTHSWPDTFNDDVHLNTDNGNFEVTTVPGGNDINSDILLLSLPHGVGRLVVSSLGPIGSDGVNVVLAVPEFDLAVTSMRWSDSLGGIDFTYSVVGGSLGRASTVASFWGAGTNLVDRLSSVPLYTCAIAAGFIGQSGQTIPASALVNPPSGATTVLLEIDPDNLFTESSKTNNFKALEIPDYGITSLGWNTSAGIDFGYFVTGFQAPASTIQLFWSKGTHLADRVSTTPVYTYNISAGVTGLSQTISVPANVLANPPSQATAVLLAIDPNNVVTETTKTNNIRALYFATITALRVARQEANVTPSNGIDDPILPVTNPTVLANARPLGLGVVADGVTPVLFKIVAPPGDYSLTINSYPVYKDTLSTHLSVLSPNGLWAKQTTINISQPPDSAANGTNYAYLAGTDWTDYATTLPEGTITLSLSRSSGGSPLSNVTFTNRPPPIVLVHGYYADATTWGPVFKSALEVWRPNDFIIPISYGVLREVNPSSGAVTADKTVNTAGRLDDLVYFLDYELAATIENLNSDLRKKWAFTRYDIVGHSQGGVLTRMLCTKYHFVTFTKQPYVSEVNMFRGRFRRIITIGSPHNGSRLLYYLLQLKRTHSIWYRLLPAVLDDIVQDKFDPFGQQIEQINDSLYSIDKRAKFRLITCTIDGGNTPGLLSPPIFLLTGLATPLVVLNPLPTIVTRGAVVIPKGSDGVVDLDAQGDKYNGSSVITTNLTGNILHADMFPLLFGAFYNQSETTFWPVASTILTLLNGPASTFGPFEPPSRLSADDRGRIDSVLPTLEAYNVIRLIPGYKDLSYSFQVSPDPSRPVQGPISWCAEAFTPNGVNSDGIALITTSNAPMAVTVRVAEFVVGDVVLYASYASTNNVLVAAQPILVCSRPAGSVMTGVFVVPGSATLSVGGTLRPDVWANYTNGAQSQLYIPIGQASFSSSDTNVAVVDVSGTITLHSFGIATVTMLYNGFTASILVSSATREVKDLAGYITTNGLFQLTYMGTYMMTNVIQASDNLKDWIPIATLHNTNGFVKYTDTESAMLPRRYYRIVIK